jgi:hypothetical protein
MPNKVSAACARRVERWKKVDRKNVN